MEHWNLIHNQPLLKTIFTKLPIIFYKKGKSSEVYMTRKFFPGFWQFNMYDKLWDFKNNNFFLWPLFFKQNLLDFEIKLSQETGNEKQGYDVTLFDRLFSICQIGRFPLRLFPRRPLILRSVMNCVTPLGVSIGSRVTVMKGKLELSMVLSSHMKMSRLRIVAKKLLKS